jgi:hypothetical protein
MANLGEVTEIFNASQLTLGDGTDTYGRLMNLQLHVARTETRTPTTDGAALYTFGKGDSWFSGTIVITHPEASTLNTLTQISATGDMTSTTWQIKGTAKDASTVTWACTGILREYDIRKPLEGPVEIDILVRITTDTVPDS